MVWENNFEARMQMKINKIFLLIFYLITQSFRVAEEVLEIIFAK